MLSNLSVVDTQSNRGEFGGDPTDSQVRRVLQGHARLGVDALSIDQHADLYEAGMTSLASVNVMLALENAFNVEFPDQFLNRSVFSSVASICAAVRRVNGS